MKKIRTIPNNAASVRFEPLFDQLLKQTEHRPYPLPQNPWAMSMVWEKLLFMHWPVRAEQLRQYVPAAFEIDTFDGTAWIGVIPFGMTHVLPRNVPSLPLMSKFLELNVRTYVKHEGRQAVYFFSLDAANLVAVEAARLLFHLPYFDALMHCAATASGIDYKSKRWDFRGAPLKFHATYRPTGEAVRSEQGSLAAFLTERYCLVTTDRAGRPRVGHIHHMPWQLAPAQVEVRQNTMLDSLKLELLANEPVLHYSEKLQTLAWALR